MLYIHELPPKMKIPLQSEIAKYMHEKMNWQMDFCNHYADKFWNYYNAQGWKLSNGNTMKDWQSAFNAQWKIPKDKTDLELLEQSKRNFRMNDQNGIQFMDAVLMSYKEGFKPTRDTAITIYDYLKARGWMKLPKEIIKEIVDRIGNDRDKGKIWSIKYLFDIMIEKNETFKSRYQNND